jgi:hypothetical protein
MLQSIYPESIQHSQSVLTLLCLIVLTVFWRERFLDQWGGTLVVIVLHLERPKLS